MGGQVIVKVPLIWKRRWDAGASQAEANWLKISGRLTYNGVLLTSRRWTQPIPLQNTCGRSEFLVDDPNRFHTHFPIILRALLGIGVAVVGREYLDDQQRRVRQYLGLGAGRKDNQIRHANSVSLPTRCSVLPVIPHSFSCVKNHAPKSHCSRACCHLPTFRSLISPSTYSRSACSCGRDILGSGIAKLWPSCEW